MTTFTVTASGGISIGGTSKVELILHSETLIKNAHELFARGDYGVAVILATTACEVGTDRAFSLALMRKGLSEEIDEAMGDLFVSYNITNERFRKLFVAITGVQIADQPFWAPLKECVKLRNKVAHTGIAVSKPLAAEALAAADQLVLFLKRHFG